MSSTVMVNTIHKAEVQTLFQYLEGYLKYRLGVDLKKENEKAPQLHLGSKESPLGSFISNHELSEVEVLLLLLALAPHITPSLLQQIVSSYFPEGGQFVKFGGVTGKNYRGIIPTGETALYMMAGDDVNERLELIKYISTGSRLFNEKILYIESVPIGEPKMSGKLCIDEEYLSLFLLGKVSKPTLSQNFPASLIDTRLEWEDLVLQEKTLDQIREIEIWLKYNEVLMDQWNMKSKIKPGYRVLFYGPPGTGKTLTASLLGKYTNRDVYRIDLSMVISKYIGETEKNLSSLFDKAANKDWILFFDEADAIFGKRTNVRDAHDKYANQEVSYLLQRIEAHPGLVILASNFKTNIDGAFTRRFQTIIEFQLPGADERLRLWKNILPNTIQLENEVSLEEIAKKYAITGANIVNIVQFSCLKTIAGKDKTINLTYLHEGLKKEYNKEGKTISISPLK
ncbi:ATP-binding protein [Aquimarina sp. ERC-38]|uniref:ATP-binding protein n=1 Tax=Aquimarina sp. ERC-38 TaxID=2949996 RepID=UPI002247F954|nr:ATP-binding protein [Aquimarina sp. ERC-38]UZO81747.1 ATP-binding protein [Aquimarina sp. ERC-38]